MRWKPQLNTISKALKYNKKNHFRYSQEKSLIAFDI